VLIVDDNETSRRLLHAHAVRWGMRPIALSSAREALAFFGSGARCDVAVIDGSMPEMDGSQLIRAVRRLYSAEVLPVVMLTSLGEATMRREADRGMCAAFVAKPVKGASLRDALLTALSSATQAASEPGARLFDGDLGRRHPLRILLAEDNSVNQRVAIQMLKKLGYRADTAANGVEALEALDRQPYDVVLMDVQMPELDGLEATRELRRRSARGPRQYVIAMTASVMREDREACFAAGMDDYVPKPLAPRELVAALRRASAARGSAQ
jgi:CheY-like chemotaxis protein